MALRSRRRGAGRPRRWFASRPRARSRMDRQRWPGETAGLAGVERSPLSQGASPLPTPAVDLPQAERFLYRVSVSALNGEMVADVRRQVARRTCRSHCRRPIVSAKLGEQRFTTSEDMLTALMSAARGPAAIPRTKRAVHLFALRYPNDLHARACAVSVSVHLFVRRIGMSRGQTRGSVDRLKRLTVPDNRGAPSTNPESHALEVYVAGRHRAH